jgi:hypothetical protein
MPFDFLLEVVGADDVAAQTVLILHHSRSREKRFTRIFTGFLHSPNSGASAGPA